MSDEITAAVKASPAIGGAAWVTTGPPAGLIAGLTLNDWVALITILYVTLQVGLLLPKYWAMLRRRLGLGGESA